MAFLCKSQRVYIIVLVIRWEWLSSYYITKEKSPSVQSVQSLSHVWLFVTPWTAARQASLSITNFLSILSLMFIESVMSSNHLILCCPFFIHLQSFPAPGSYPMSQFFTSGGQSTGASASALVLAMNIQGWFPLCLTGTIFLQSKRLLRVFSNTII